MAVQDNGALGNQADAFQQSGPVFNGIKQILVRHCDTTAQVPVARFLLQFYNSLKISEIITAYNTASDRENTASGFFAITGGIFTPADTGENNIRVTGIAPCTSASLELTISPIGDYSLYRLTITDQCPVYDVLDPVFGSVPFEFRLGCFSPDCRPDMTRKEIFQSEPVIDCRTGDHDSGRYAIAGPTIKGVSGWRVSGDSARDQAGISLFRIAASGPADSHNPVADGVYAGIDRRSVSPAMHARLAGYPFHQGNQGSTWLFLAVNTEVRLGEGIPPHETFLQVSTEGDRDKTPVIFRSRGFWYLHPSFNDIRLYTRSGTQLSLEMGCTTADLILDTKSKNHEEKSLRLFMQAISNGLITHLLIQEHLDPVTGKPDGFDQTKRQVLELIRSGEKGPVIMTDPMQKRSFIRVCWQETDRLKETFHFSLVRDNTLVEDISMFHGNLVTVYHGEEIRAHFLEQGSVLKEGEYEYQRPKRHGKNLGAVCRLERGPLAYQQASHEGKERSLSTLEVFECSLNPTLPEKYLYSPMHWKEVNSFFHCNTRVPDGKHFIVETDKEGNSLVRFGNGTNGCEIVENSILLCRYQVGSPLDGNILSDTLTVFDHDTFPFLDRCTNPFDVMNGRPPEPVREKNLPGAEEIGRGQMRLITLKDYERRAEEVPGVLHASARYVWRSNLRAVRLAIDPSGTHRLDPQLQSAVARHLEVMRLAGEELEIRPPFFIPLEISVKACITGDCQPEEIRNQLEQEFSTCYTSDGRVSFFHPDLWTFGQGLEVSQIIGRVLAVPGINHVREVSIRRMHPYGPSRDRINNLGIDEIILVKNDPYNRNTGVISFDLVKGG